MIKSIVLGLFIYFLLFMVQKTCCVFTVHLGWGQKQVEPPGEQGGGKLPCGREGAPLATPSLTVALV
jgi:hypothetical protein